MNEIGSVMAGAEERRQAAEARDKTGEARDAKAEARHEIVDTVDSAAGFDRAAARHDRLNAADDRAGSAADRVTSYSDRIWSAGNRAASSFDGLTGACCRDAGLVELGRDIAKAKRSGHHFVLAFVDVDGLKVTNDSLGHDAGDQVLRGAAGHHSGPPPHL